MKSKTMIVLAAAAAVLVLAWSVIRVLRAGASGAAPPGAASSDSPAPELGAPAIAALDEGSERESIERVDGEPVAVSLPTAAGGAPSRSTLRGRVLDAEGRTVAGVGIFVGPFPSDPARGIRRRSTVNFSLGGLEDAGESLPKPTQRIGQSGKAGRFEIPRLPDGSVLHARDEGHAAVLAFDWYASDPGDPEAILVVAAPSAVAGIVVDDQGRPIEGVEITVEVPDSLRSALGLILDRASALEYFCRSGADGHFEIADAPGVAGRQLVATREGSPSLGQPIAVEPQIDLRIVFQLGQGFDAAARGIVLDAQDVPVPDASLRLGHAVARSGKDGRFVLDATAAEPGLEILAAKPGFAPGRAVYDPEVADFVVRIGPPTARIAGRVIDANGRPMTAVDVRAIDLTHVDEVALEDMATWDGPGPFTRDDTDTQGRFEIGGLDARAYVLELFDGRTMRSLQTEPIQAGKHDAQIRFRSDVSTGRIAGRVVDRAGGAVSAAEVWIARRKNDLGERVEVFARADGEGAFEFPDVALDVDSARVAFPGELSFDYPIEAGQDLQHLVFVTYRRVHLQVDVSGSDLFADTFGVVDGTGKELPIAKYEGNMSTSSMRWPIQDERSDVLGALDATEAVVLYRRGVEVGRIQVHLVPGEVTVVRP